VSPLSENEQSLLPSLSKIRSEFEALCVEQVDHAKIAEAIHQLLNDLKNALDMFTRKDKEAGQILTLWGLHGFLDTVGVSTRLRAPLCSLISDITGVPDRKGSEKPLEDITEMVMASAALDTLVTDGTDMRVAARKIVEVAGRAMSADELINFRRNLQRKRARSEAVSLYHALQRASAEQWRHLSKQERAMQALLSVYGNIVPAKEC